MFGSILKDVLSPSNLWAIAQWLFPVATATVSVWASYFSKLPLPVTIYLATMSAGAVLAIVSLAKTATAFEKISLDDIRPIHFITSEDRLSLIQLGAVVKNHHVSDPIFFSFEVLNLALQEKTNVDFEQIGDVNIAAPNGGERSIIFPMIRDIREGDVTGRLHVRIHYGKLAKKLKYTREMKYVLKGVIYPVGAQYGLTLNCLLQEIKSS